MRFNKKSLKTKGVKTMAIEGAEQRAVAVEEGDVFLSADHHFNWLMWS